MTPPPLTEYYLQFILWAFTLAATAQLILNRKCYEVSKPEMELHMINIIYAALPMRAQTEKTAFSCKDDCTLTKHTRRWPHSALRYFFFRAFWSLNATSLYKALSVCMLCIASVQSLWACLFNLSPKAPNSVWIGNLVNQSRIRVVGTYTEKNLQNPHTTQNADGPQKKKSIFLRSKEQKDYQGALETQVLTSIG